MGCLPVISGLLDTHALLWTLADDDRLPDALAAEIDADPAGFAVSDVSLWEIAIKRSTGRLTVPDDLPQIVDGLGFTAVPIQRRQAWGVRDLPFHHRDPFDRLLVAQARDLGLPLISADPQLRAYDIDLRWG